MRMPLILTVAVLTAAAPAYAAAANAAGDSGRRLSTSLSGAAEVPGPGDSDGSGSAQIRINPGQTQLCYTVTYRNIVAPTAAHVHRGGTTVAGPVVVPLTVAANGSIMGCATVTRALAQEIIRNPAAFYVNVHNSPFPNGAIRGQLGK